MSINDTRAALAAALTTVDDITGYEDRPSTASVGDAWPLLGPLDRADGLVFYVTWRVMVMLPPDTRAAADFIEQHAGPLIVALNPVIYVDRLEPVSANADGSGQAFLEITGRGE